MVQRFASYAGKILYALAEIDRFGCFFACGNNFFKAFSVGCDIIFSASGVCVRTDHKVSVNGRGNKNSFSKRAGALEHNVFKKSALVFVENIILPFGGIYGKTFVADHFRDGITINSRGVYNEFCLNFLAVFSADHKVSVFFFY